MQSLNHLIFFVVVLLLFAGYFALHRYYAPQQKDVPAPVQTTFQRNTSGGKVKEVEKETVNGQTIYLAEVKGADGKWSKIYVKEAGDLLKVEPDNARNKRKHKPLFGD